MEAINARLRGMRVWVTRPRERALELCFLLEEEGAEVIGLPLLELLPPDDPRPLRSAAEQIHRYGFILFASPSGAQALCEAVHEAGTFEQLERAKIAVVGPGTASAVARWGLKVFLEAEVHSGEGLLQQLRPLLTRNDEVLLPAAQEGRPELYQGLREMGVAVTRVAAYRSSPKQLPAELQASLLLSPPQAILFGSPRTAEALLEAFGDGARPLLSATKTVAIGPTTASALQALGISVSAVAAQPTSEALVDATIRVLSG